MTFSNPSRPTALTELSGLIPQTKFSRRIPIPWTPEEQRAIRWMGTADPKQLSTSQRAVKNSAAHVVVKTLSASQLSDLVKRWKQTTKING